MGLQVYGFYTVGRDRQKDDHTKHQWTFCGGREAAEKRLSLARVHEGTDSRSSRRWIKAKSGAAGHSRLGGCGYSQRMS